MGWWRVEGTQCILGDGPLDTLGDAVRDVIKEYEAALHRRPTRSEWEALLLGVLGAEEPDARVLDEGIVENVRIEIEPAAMPLKD